MNKVFLSGVIADTPVLKHPKNETTHLVFLLRVRHRTAKGEHKSELYRVNAWGNKALWGWENLRQGQLVTAQGYLTQHIRENGILAVEVTAEEFLPGAKPSGQAREAGLPAEDIALMPAVDKKNEAVSESEAAS